MRLVFAAAIVAATLLSSCSSKHSGPSGTSAVAKQLVGHWSTQGNDNLYFGAIDQANKTGSFIMVHPDGKSFPHRYEIKSEDSGDRTIKVNLLFADGDSREETMVIAEDGKSIAKTTTITGIEVQSELTKVDDETAP